MRKTVCKRLRDRATALAPEAKKTGFIKRFWTGKYDDKGKKVTFDRTTVMNVGR